MNCNKTVMEHRSELLHLEQSGCSIAQGIYNDRQKKVLVSEIMRDNMEDYRLLAGILFNYRKKEELEKSGITNPVERMLWWIQNTTGKGFNPNNLNNLSTE